jgi:hypothetical protein
MVTGLLTETQSRAEAMHQKERCECTHHSRSQVLYADGRTHRKCGWSRCSTGVAVSSIRLRTRNSRSVARASSREQCRTSWIVRTPSACRPCSVSTGPRCTSASQTSCSCSDVTSQVYFTGPHKSADPRKPHRLRYAPVENLEC